MSELIQIEEIAQVKQGRYTSPSELSATPKGNPTCPFGAPMEYWVTPSMPLTSKHNPWSLAGETVVA